MEPKPTTGTTSGRVAANVRGMLAARKIRRADFVAALGWSTGTATRRMNGGTWVAEDVEAAAAFLGVDVATLTQDVAA